MIVFVLESVSRVARKCLPLALSIPLATSMALAAEPPPEMQQVVDALLGSRRAELVLLDGNADRRIDVGDYRTFQLMPTAATPSPTDTPSPTASPTATPTASPTATPSPSPSPTPLPDRVTIDLPAGQTMEFVRIPAGTFMMGSPEDELSRRFHEGPLTEVTITRDFYMGIHEVTNNQAIAVDGGGRPIDDKPISVTWGPTQRLVASLNSKLLASGDKRFTARLPTEAEWEYAARAGTNTRFSFGDSPTAGDNCEADDSLSLYMYYCGNSGSYGGNTPGEKLPNPYGLFDMHGNAMEWVSDWYAPALPGGSVTDPTGPPSGYAHVARGGANSSPARMCRSASRHYSPPPDTFYSLPYYRYGVRLCLTVNDATAPSPTAVPTPIPTPVSVPGDEVLTVLLPGDVPLVLQRIPMGTFLMGSPETERGRQENEGPITAVTISRPYYIGKYEVSREQWKAVMGNIAGDGLLSLAVSHASVTWEEAKQFASALNEHILATGQGPLSIRLPTEAEWEYAARAGTSTRFSFGDSLEAEDRCGFDLTRADHMWYCGYEGYRIMPPGYKLPNAFGLYDMHGNVSEWCEDWLGEYPGGSVTDPTGPESGTERVYRGGDWASTAVSCRSAARLRPQNDGSNMSSVIGIRVAASYDEENFR